MAKHKPMPLRAAGAVLGAIVFRIVYALALRFNMPAFMLKLVSAVIVVLAMDLVGSLLISALVVFPALSAMRVFKSFRSVIIFSAVVSVSCAVIGILVSILADTPVGSTIVAADIVAFIGFCAAGAIMRRK